MHPPVPHPILIVEDNDHDFRQSQRAFEESRLANPIFRCIDGEDALDFLHRRGEYADPATAPRPGIILLDLRLPRTDGREVLRDIKEDADLKTIPVVVLTSSSDERDIEDCYDAGANSYIVKPVTFEGYLDAIRRLEEYWLEIVILPGQHHI